MIYRTRVYSKQGGMTLLKKSFLDAIESRTHATHSRIFMRSRIVTLSLSRLVWLSIRPGNLW